MCCLFCACYKLTNKNAPDTNHVPLNDRIVILYWQDHRFGLYNAKATESHIYGQMTPGIPMRPCFEETEPVLITHNIKAIGKQSRIFIHLDSTFVLNEPFTGNASIPLTFINNVEIFDRELDANKSIVSGAIAVILISVMTLGILGSWISRIELQGDGY